MSKVIRVVVVDDSVLIRHMLTEIINRQADMEVVGAAPDPLIAREMIRNLNPDVITLDVEMPKMDGLDFLGRLMRLRPTPVVMISTLTERGSETTLRALELGAVDFIAKPRVDVGAGLEDYAELIAEKIRIASVARLRPTASIREAPPLHTADAILPAVANKRVSGGEPLIFIGASTGGTEAIKEVLLRLPENLPGILITQHMPEGFTRSYAQRLDSLCRMHVKEAEHGERVQKGWAYVAPGHSHMLVKRSTTGYMIELNQGPPVNRHRPSVDVLFRSAANTVANHAIGVILTGMGKDGAHGLREMHDAGAYTLAQNKDSCIVYGMPKEAVLAGGVDEELPLDHIARKILAVL